MAAATAGSWGQNDVAGKASASGELRYHSAASESWFFHLHISHFRMLVQPAEVRAGLAPPSLWFTFPQHRLNHGVPGSG